MKHGPPDHPDTRVVVHVQKRQLLFFLACSDVVGGGGLSLSLSLSLSRTLSLTCWGLAVYVQIQQLLRVRACVLG